MVYISMFSHCSMLSSTLFPFCLCFWFLVDASTTFTVMFALFIVFVFVLISLLLTCRSGTMSLGVNEIFPLSIVSWLIFIRPHVYIGSELCVLVSPTTIPCWDLTDVTLADEDTNSILTDNAKRAIQGNEAMQVM